MSAPSIDSRLSGEQVTHYWDHGYVNNIPVLTTEEVGDYRSRFEAIEAEQREQGGGTWQNKNFQPREWTDRKHPLESWFHELSTHEKILDAVEGILGPNILIRNADVFIKEPNQRRGINWHIDTPMNWQDAKYILTAWIGLTPSTATNGCLQFIPGTHDRDLPDGPKDKYSLTLKPECLRHLDPTTKVRNVMPIGHMSMHSFRTVHASGGNSTNDRRFGFVVRFMTPSTSKETAESGVAFLARGTDDYGHFMLKESFPVSWN